MQALVYSYAERIGHGIQMFNDDSFHSETKVNDTRKFVRDLGEYVGKTRICVEVGNFNYDITYYCGVL